MTEKTQDTLLPTQKLKPRQKAFVEAYFNSAMNASEAYMATHPGCGYGTAKVNGCRLLANANVMAEVERRLSEQVMSANEVLKRLSDMAKANLLPFIRITDEGFTYFDFSHPDAKNYFHLIKKIKTKRARRVEGRGENAEVWEDEWVEVELHDAQSALEKIGKYHHLFKNEVDVTSGGEKVKAVEFILGAGADGTGADSKPDGED